MKRDILKRNRPFFYTLKGLSNKQQLFFTSLALKKKLKQLLLNYHTDSRSHATLFDETAAMA